MLAATDPANPFGAALPWPDASEEGGHRPGRKAGALVVVMVDGELVIYVERGGKSLLTWSDDPAALAAAAAKASRRPPGAGASASCRWSAQTASTSSVPTP